MGRLIFVYWIKILGTLAMWCVPLLLLPRAVLADYGVSASEVMFLRMLGWAYIALCVGYGFGLRAAMAGRLETAPLWVGVVSNGGAAVLMTYHMLADGAFAGLPLMQGLIWLSAASAAGITVGLWYFGLRTVKQ